MVSSAKEHRKRPSDEVIWQLMESVPDPEIPVISVVDLGIVRGFHWEDETLVVAITPTYSGCPASSVIALQIQSALVRSNIGKVRTEVQLSPPWTTDWISQAGLQKLADYGIAPPEGGSTCAGAIVAKAQDGVRCPHCKSTDTKCVSTFGSTPCKALYRCEHCLEPFDYFKVH